MRTIGRSAIGGALGVLFALLPALALAACPSNGQPYDFKGVVQRTGVTKDGRPFYAISAAACGDERRQIVVYPPAAVPACMIGRRAQAGGVYNKNCVVSVAGPTCSVQSGLNSPTGAFLTCK